MSEFAAQMLAGKIHAKSRVRASRLAHAVDGVRRMVEVAPNSYVSISFGKQSICMAHMVYRIAPETPMFFLASDETWDMHNFREVIDDFLTKWPIRLKIVQTNRLYGAASWKAGRDAGDKDLQRMCPREEWDGWYMGLASDESRARKITLLKHCSAHRTIYRYRDGKYRCCPLMDWTLDDIAAYVWEHDLPLLDIYRKVGLHMRTTARLTKKAVELGGGWARVADSRGRRRIKNIHQEIDI